MSNSPVVRLVDVPSDYVGQRLDNFLMRLCKGVPKSHLYKAIRGGQVRINKGRCSADTRLAEGDQVRIPPFRLPAESTQPAAPGSEFPIIFEDDALLVIDKPAGVAVHGGSGVSFGVIEQLRAARPDARFLELAHRLDRETSGLLLIAKKRSALLGLHEMFREGRGRKHYLALVHGDWVNGRQNIKLPLLKWLTRTGERRVRVDAEEGQAAHTIVSLKRRYGAVSLVDAELRTGRTHQIRVHLSASGFPILGDDKYGDEAADAPFVRQGFRRMFLHAHTLDIPHPLSGVSLRLVAQLPSACENLLESLQAQAAASRTDGKQQG